MKSQNLRQTGQHGKTATIPAPARLLLAVTGVFSEVTMMKKNTPLSKAMKAIAKMEQKEGESPKPYMKAMAPMPKKGKGKR